MSCIQQEVFGQQTKGCYWSFIQRFFFFSVRCWALAKAPPKSKIWVCGMWASRCDESDLLWGWCSSALSKGLLPVGLLFFALDATWIQLWNDLALQATQNNAVCKVCAGLMHRCRSCLCILTASCTFLFFSRSESVFVYISLFFLRERHLWP